MFGIVTTYSEQVNGKDMAGGVRKRYGSMSVSQSARVFLTSRRDGGRGEEECVIDLPESSGRPSSVIRL